MVPERHLKYIKLILRFEEKNEATKCLSNHQLHRPHTETACGVANQRSSYDNIHRRRKNDQLDEKEKDRKPTTYIAGGGTLNKGKSGVCNTM